MRKILILLICFLAVSASSQYSRKINPAIYFIGYRHCKLIRIRHGVRLGYFLTAEPQYREGRVSRISSDTMFINTSCFRIRDVMLITNPKIIGRNDIPDPQSYQKRGTIFRNDTADWNYFCPSPDAYFSRVLMQAEIKAFINDARAKRNIRNYDPIRSNYLFLNPGRLLFFDIAVSYERKLSAAYSFGIEGGYKFSVQNADGASGLYPFAQAGPSLITGPKIYFHKKFYFSPLLHVKYLEVHHSYFKDPFSGPSPTMMDQFRTLAGISLRIGKMVYADPVWFDFFIGGGLKLAYTHQISYYYYYQDQIHYYNAGHTPVVSTGYYWLPLISIGVKVGYGF